MEPDFEVVEALRSLVKEGEKTIRLTGYQAEIILDGLNTGWNESYIHTSQDLISLLEILKENFPEESKHTDWLLKEARRARADIPLHDDYMLTSFGA